MKQLGSNAAILTAIAGVLIIASMVADRFGASSATVVVLVLMLAVLSVAFAALSTATMKVSAFSAAGHRQPLVHATLLMACNAGGLVVLGGHPTPVASLPLLLAVASGLLIATSVAGVIRRSGATSLAEIMQSRFRSRAVTLITALLTMVPLGLLAAFAGDAATALLAEAMHLSRWQTTLFSAVMVGLMLLPGGALGLVSVALIFGAMSAVAWGVPLVSAVAMPESTVVQVWSRTAAQFLDTGGNIGLTLGYAFGASGLFVLLAGAATAAGARTAAGAHIIAAMLVVCAGAAAIMVQNTVVVTTERLQGASPAALPPALYSERARGLVTICGIVPIHPAEAQKACDRLAATTGKPAPMLAVSPRRDGLWPALVLELPLVMGVVHGLAMPLLALFAFAAVVRALAQTLVNDAVYRLGDWSGTASGRLALTRIAMVLLICLSLAGFGPLTGSRTIARAAFFIAAAVPVPMLLLASWRGADWRAALCALLAAAGVATAILFRLLPDGLALLAAVLAAVMAGWLASLMFPSKDPRDSEAADVLAGRLPGPLHLDRSA